MADQPRQSNPSGSQSRPASPAQAPDPSRSYERSRPGDEAGMGRLDNNAGASPTARPDSMPGSVPNRQDPDRQLNAHDVVNNNVNNNAAPSREQPDHSMLDEEPTGWDQAPQDIQNPEEKRHPRQEGKGGTP